MKISLLFVAFLIATFFGQSLAIAGFIFQVDMDRDTPGVQSTIASQTGSFVQADLLLRLTGTSTLSSYNVSLRFDVSELTFVSRSFDLPPSPLFELDLADRNPPLNGLPAASSGTLYRFDGASLGQGLITPGDFVVSRMTFLVSNPGGTTSDVDIVAGLFEPTFDAVFDSQLPFGNDVTNQVVFIGGSVTAVPEPTSITLISMAMLMGSKLVWNRKRRKLRS